MSKIIITLDSSQMRSFMTCEQQWARQYIMNLRFHREQSIYADKGSFVHKLLELFYVLRTLNPKEDRFKTQRTVIALWKSGKLFKANGLDKETEKFIIERFIQYVMRWIAYDFIPQQRNGVPGVEIGFSKVLLETNDFIFVVEGKIDLLSKTVQGFDCFVDNKTQEQMKDLYRYKIQFLTYAWATGFKWAYINYFRLQKTYDPDTTFRRELIYFQDWQIQKWEDKMYKIFQRILDVMNDNRITDQNKLLPEMFEQNLNSCAGPDEKRPCYFTLLCENPEHEKGLTTVYYKKVPKWRPYELEVAND